MRQTSEQAMTDEWILMHKKFVERELEYEDACSKYLAAERRHFIASFQLEEARTACDRKNFEWWFTEEARRDEIKQSAAVMFREALRDWHAFHKEVSNNDDAQS